MLTAPLTLHALYLPLPPLQLLPFLIVCPYHRPFVTQHMAIQGCFKTTSFDINHWHVIFAINPFCFSFSSLLLSRTFFATSFAEKMHALFLPDNYPRNLFSRSFLCYNFSFFLMSHIYIEGIEPPCKPLSCCTLGFIRGKGDTALNNTRLWLSLWIH